MGQYVISMNSIHHSENLVLKPVRAKYIIQPDGSKRLAAVMEFSRPVFNPGGFIPVDDFRVTADDVILGDHAENLCSAEQNLARARRRAKIQAFDYILANPDLNVFVTLTYDPEKVESRSCYEEVYHKLKVFLGNRVARHGLKYVCVPEHHKDGEAIHWHMICNGRGLDLYPSGHRSKNGHIYNVRAWKWGFSTAVFIGGTVTDRDRVCKYVYKYMGKQDGAMIGGRYYLHGGQLELPIYEYYDDVTDICTNYGTAPYKRECEPVPGVLCREWTFI